MYIFKGALFSPPHWNDADLLPLVFHPTRRSFLCIFQRSPSRTSRSPHTQGRWRSPNGILIRGHPFTSPHLLASPVLKRVPGKPDHPANFNELSAGSTTSVGVPWTDAFQRTISFRVIQAWFMVQLFFFFFTTAEPIKKMARWECAWSQDYFEMGRHPSV